MTSRASSFGDLARSQKPGDKGTAPIRIHNWLKLSIHMAILPATRATFSIFRITAAYSRGS